MTSKLRTALIASCLLSFAFPASGQTLRIYNIDVEQADAALIVMPNGKTLLVDSGKNGEGGRVKAVMDKAGVTTIDAFVDSHYHEDHFGGIDDLVDMGVQVLESYDRGDKDFLPASKKAQKTFKDYMRTVGEDAITLHRGDTINLDPLVTVTCISSGGVVVGEANPVPGAEENDLSVSLLLTFDGFRAFFGGDIEQPTEAKIAAGDLVKDVDFYKADHHGSHTSSSQALMDDLHPSVIVVSNGNDATYKHPRQVTLNTYAALPGPPLVLQTNKCFRAAPCANVPDAFIADPQTADDDGTIVTTVDAATHSYTVAWSNSTRTLQIKAQPVTPTASVVIESLLPNPVGEDEQLEEVTVKNKGSAAVSLAGWTLRDRSNLTWTLSGSLAPGQSQTFKRSGQPMSLNNAGDEIRLFDAANVERDVFTYDSSTEGVRIATNH